MSRRGPSPDDLTPSIFAPALVQPVQSDPGRAPGGDDDDDALLGLHGELILRRVIGRGSMGRGVPGRAGRRRRGGGPEAAA
jgi:hypothetical protein